MATIAVLIHDLFEDSEYSKPADAFKNEGHKLVHLGFESGKEVKGLKQQTPVIIDEAIEEADVDDFDALLIPGGFSPDQLRAKEKPVEFVKAFVNSGKPVFAICHAPQLLITADVLKGRKITGYISIVQDIKNAGAEYIDEQVVIDRNLISSRNPDDIPAFNKACLDMLENLKGATV